MANDGIKSSTTPLDLRREMARLDDVIAPFSQLLADEIKSATESKDGFQRGFDALKRHLVTSYADELNPMFAALAAGADGPIGAIVTDSLRGMIRFFAGVEPNYKAEHFNAYNGGRPDFVLAQKAITATDPNEFESLWDTLVGDTIVNMNRISELLKTELYKFSNSIFRDSLSDDEKRLVPVVTDLPEVAGALSLFSATWRSSRAFMANNAMMDTWLGFLIAAENGNVNNCISYFSGLPVLIAIAEKDEERVNELQNTILFTNDLEKPFEYIDGGYTQHLNIHFGTKVVLLPAEKFDVLSGDPTLVRRAIRRIMESIATTYGAADSTARANATVKVEFNEDSHKVSFIEQGGIALLSGLAEGTAARARLNSIADQMATSGRLTFNAGRIDLRLPAYKPFNTPIQGVMRAPLSIPRMI